MKRPKALFVKSFAANAKFVTNDLIFLNEKFDVKLLNVKITKDFRGIIAFIKLFLYSLLNTWRFHLIYVWFADYHSFSPVFFGKLYKKKGIICAGGYECTFIPEINCGVFTDKSIMKKLRKFAVTFSLMNCNIILPVDESLI